MKRAAPADSSSSKKRAPLTCAVGVDFALASGRRIAELSADLRSTGMQLKQALVPHLPEGTRVNALCVGEHVITDTETLAESGFEPDKVIQVTLSALSTLYCLGSCSSIDLSRRHGTWYMDVFSESMCTIGSEHEDLCNAPPVARDIVNRVRGAFGENLASRYMGAAGHRFFFWHSAELVIITNPSESAKESCLRALAIREQVGGTKLSVWSMANVACNPTGLHQVFDLQNNLMESAYETPACLQKGLDLFNELTRDRFYMYFDIITDESNVPALYGAYAPDGNIVGVLMSYGHRIL